MRKFKKTQQMFAASALAVTLFTAAPTPASAGPLVCVGSAAVAATGWLGYGLFKVFTAPVTIWTTPLEVGVLSGAGAATIELVTAACAAPTP